MHMFSVDDLEAEARQKAGTETGWAMHRNMAVAFYPNSNRFNYFISNDVVSKREFVAYLTHGWRRVK